MNNARNNSYDHINHQTGFANGDSFGSEQEVREYFTTANVRDMFSSDNDAPDQSTLDRYAVAVITNNWHCNF